MRYLLVVFLVLLVVLAVSLSAIAQDTEAGEIVGLELLEDYPAIQFWFEAYTGRYPVLAERRKLCNEFIVSDAIMWELRDEQYPGVTPICADFGVFSDFFADAAFTFENVVAEDNVVVVRYTTHYTYSHGSTKERITFPAMVMFQLEGEQLEVIWNYFDLCDAVLAACSE